jgi:UDP-2,3-diacylglucosamine pyrophosphatase LpxH
MVNIEVIDSSGRSLGLFDKNKIITSELSQNVSLEEAIALANKVESIIIASNLQIISIEFIQQTISELKRNASSSTSNKSKSKEHFHEIWKRSDLGFMEKMAHMAYLMEQYKTEPENFYPIPNPVEYINGSPGEYWELAQQPPSEWPDSLKDLIEPVFGGGLQTSDSKAALFVSDLHMSDGTGGDDFLENHLTQEGKWVVGNKFTGTSKANLLARVITFVQGRLKKVFPNDTPKFDLVLNGDIVDQLEMMARNTTLHDTHKGFFSICNGLRNNGHKVFYVRGNHDYVVPPGPWQKGTAYENTYLTTFAEHGDMFDKRNWPPGPDSWGSKFVLGNLLPGFPSPADIETLIFKGPEGKFKAWYSGMDNVATSDLKYFMLKGKGFNILDNFLSAIALNFSTYQDVIDEMERLDPGSIPDVRGALFRTLIKYPDYLMVQGHTHVPVSIPGSFYNTGTWTPHVKVLKDVRHSLLTGINKRPDAESFNSINPFLLVYKKDGDANRTEEFYTVNQTGKNEQGKIALRNQQSINELRWNFFDQPPVLGYPPIWRIFY